MLCRSLSRLPTRDDSDRLDLLLGDGRAPPERIALRLRVTMTNQIALQQMCEQAMELACLFHVDVRAALDRGALVRVLPRSR